MHASDPSFGVIQEYIEDMKRRNTALPVFSGANRVTSPEVVTRFPWLWKNDYSFVNKRLRNDAFADGIEDDIRCAVEV